MFRSFIDALPTATNNDYRVRSAFNDGTSRFMNSTCSMPSISGYFRGSSECDHETIVTGEDVAADDDFLLGDSGRDLVVVSISPGYPGTLALPSPPRIVADHLLRLRARISGCLPGNQSQPGGRPSIARCSTTRRNGQRLRRITSDIETRPAELPLSTSATRTPSLDSIEGHRSRRSSANHDYVVCGVTLPQPAHCPRSRQWFSSVGMACCDIPCVGDTDDPADTAATLRC